MSAIGTIRACLPARWLASEIAKAEPMMSADAIRVWATGAEGPIELSGKQLCVAEQANRPAPKAPPETP